MKKIFTFCLFAFGLLLTTETVHAQQQTFSAEVNQKAYQKTAEYGRQLKADQVTQEAMYIAFQEYFDKTNRLNNNHAMGSSDFKELQAQIDNKLTILLKNLLSEDQFVKYLELTDQIKDK